VRKIMQECLDKGDKRGIVNVKLHTYKGFHKQHQDSKYDWVQFAPDGDTCFRLFQSVFGIDVRGATKECYMLLSHVEEEIRVRKIVAELLTEDGALRKRKTKGCMGSHMSTSPVLAELEVLLPDWAHLNCKNERYFALCDKLRKLPPDPILDAATQASEKQPERIAPAPTVETKPQTVSPLPTPANDDPLIDALRAIGKPATKHQILATGKVEARQWSTLLSDAATVYHALA
jgi:hypothetical protein